MRVALMHNPRAGHHHRSADSLAGQIRAAGHELVVQVQRRKELAAALAHRIDVVAVAGGDGTVGKAASVLRGTGVPLTVVPLGTANNIAAALGVRGIDWWDRGEVRSFDVARAHVDGDAERFIEAFGFGAFPRVIGQTLEIEAPDREDGRLVRDLEVLRKRIMASPLKSYRIDADGTDLSGSYFLVEVLNIPSIGPRVAIAPDARFDDGKLDLVVAGDGDREALRDAVDVLARGETPRRLQLPTWRVDRVHISGHMRRHHRDGTLLDHPSTEATVIVEPAALRVLVPPVSADRTAPPRR